MRVPSLIATVALVAVLLSGCLPQQPTPTPTPKPRSTPVFATDEEALAAATTAYAAYLAVSDQIAADGGKNPERLEPFVTPEQLPDVLTSFNGYIARGLHAEGQSTFDSTALVQYEGGTQSSASIDIYLCLDVSKVRVIDESGADVTPADRRNRLPLQIGFESTATTTLRLARSESWTGDNFCVR